MKQAETLSPKLAFSVCLIALALSACGGTQTSDDQYESGESGNPASGQPDGSLTSPNDNSPPGQAIDDSEPEDLPNQPDSTPLTGDTHDYSLDQWSESATWTRFDADLELPWKNAGGDWIDANGVEQGNAPFSSTALIDDNQPGPIDLDVLSAVQATGRADFFLQRSGGANFVFNSREATTNRPILIINETTIIEPSADTNLNNTTSRALGGLATLSTQGPILIRFQLPEGVSISSATLRLFSTGAEYSNQSLQVYAANAALRKISRPSWLQVDPTVIASYDGNDVLRADLSVTARNGIATARLLSPNLTWINSNKVIPNQTSACATVYQRLGTDFKPGDGGKHPGFANTGDALSGSDVVNGVTYPDSGWGGRPPDGIHWSARTGYGGWNDDFVASHTYFYAMAPHNAYGWVDPIGYPFPKGKWTAYVQCLELNTVSGSTGNPDGKLYYEISGIGPVYSREDIRWRDSGAPESEIREFWINYYCGGTSCGSIANRGTVDFAKAVLTRGLPDMSAVEAEVARLNQTYP